MSRRSRSHVARTAAALVNASLQHMPTTRGPMTADDSGRLADAPPVVEDNGAESGAAVPPASARTDGETRTIEAAVRALSSRGLEVRPRPQIAGSEAAAALSGQSTGGEVLHVDFAVAAQEQVNASPIPGNPAATIARAEDIRRAALQAPNPSVRGMSVAARAQLLEQGARKEIASDAGATVEAVTDIDGGGGAVAEQGPIPCPHCGSAHSGTEHVAIKQRLIDSAFAGTDAGDGVLGETV